MVLRWLGPKITVGVEPAPTTWTNDKGVPIEAEFVKMTDEGVVLRFAPDGREAAVPINRLSIDSIYQAVRLANPSAFSKPVPKAEVIPEGPVLPEFNMTVEDLLQNPYSESTSLEDYLEISRACRARVISSVHGIPFLPKCNRTWKI